MFKTTIKLLLTLIVVFAFTSSTFAQVIRLKPIEKSKSVIYNIPIAGEGIKRFSVEYNKNGSFTMTDEKGIQLKVTVNNNGKISQMTMPDGNKMAFNYKNVGYGLITLDSIFLNESNLLYQGNNMATYQSNDMNDMLVPIRGSTSPCGKAAEEATVANAAMFIACSGGDSYSCAAAVVVAGYYNYVMYRECSQS